MEMPGAFLERLLVDGTSLVLINGEPSRVSIPQAYYDSRDAGRQAAQHLLEQGCRKLLFFSAKSPDYQWVSDREDGVHDAIAMAGLPASAITRFVSSDPAFDVHYDKADEFAESYFEKHRVPDGVVASNDLTAVAFMNAARRRGLTAGRDYAIIGFDDVRIARTNGLTSLRPPAKDVAREALKLVLDQIAGVRGPSRVCLNSHIVARQSSHRADWARRSLDLERHLAIPITA